MLIIVLVRMLLVSVMARYSVNPGAGHDHDADDCHCKDEDVMEQSKEATGV